MGDTLRALEAELGIGKDAWVYETTQQKANRARFEAIHDGFTNHVRCAHHRV